MGREIDRKLVIKTWQQTIKDVLELLKEQEPVKPFATKAWKSGYECGACHQPLYSTAHRFCPWCGKAVKWDSD